MVWTETTRELYRRDELPFASDMLDEEWELIDVKELHNLPVD